METIKIIQCEGHIPKFEEKLNKLIKKGWSIKGNLVSHNNGLILMLSKN